MSVRRPATGPGSPGRRLHRDDGYVIALAVVLIIPIMAFVSLGIDVGAWYARAQEIQQAADAAALAAAPLTPDPVTTRAAALDSLRKNHISCTDFGGDLTCSMYPLPNSEVAYRVEITDPSVVQYFSQTFRSAPVSITRKATAERLHPIPMGSPNNYLGTNQLISGTARENYFLAISGKCASKEQGERRMTVSDANFSTTNNPPPPPEWNQNSYGRCTGGYTEANNEYDANGYTYVMNLAKDFAGTINLDVYDPVLCSNGATYENPGGNGGSRFQFRYRVKGKANNPANAPLLREWTPSNTDTACSDGTSPSSTRFRNAWVTVHQFVNPTKGMYYLQVADPSGSALTTNRSSNQFAIRARFDAPNAPLTVAPTSWTKCSTIVGDALYRADCPQIHGYRDMGVYAGVAGGQAEFFLTDVGPDYNKRTMEITLWDPGEGASKIELLDPTGLPVRFNWESEDCGTGVTEPSLCGQSNVSQLDVSGEGLQPGPHRLSRSKYNDRPLKLTYKLPDDIKSAYGGKTWWKIRYYSTDDIHDRTTWSVQIPGDPVRLVPTTD